MIGDSEEQRMGGHMASETIRIGGLELRFLQTKDDTAGSLDAFEMTVEPNARMPIAHYHESWDETTYGLAGASTWRVDGRDVVLEPGQSLFIKRGIVHAFRNDAQEAARCLCILTPGVLGPGYFREIAALVAGGAPDAAKMKEIMLRYGLHPTPQ
jgi:quercetin dioxygenase-like cupin family protein